MGQVDKTTTQVQEALDIGYDNDPTTNAAIGYDDLQGAANSATVGATAPSVYNFDVGGTTYRTTEFNVNDTATFAFQTTHATKLNTTMNFHIHYAPEGDGTGTRFQFQADVCAAAGNGTFANVTGSPFTAEVTMAGDESGDHNITGVATIPAVNSGVSTIYLVKLTRIAATQDEYSGGVIVFYADSHVEVDQERGSREEYVK